jgi:hypothetical protein
MLKHLGAILAAAALLGLTAAAADDRPHASFSALVTAENPAAAAAKSGGLEPQFAWPDDQQLAAVVNLKLDGYTGLRKLSLHAALFEDQGRDSHNEHPLVKLDGEYELASGAQRVAFPKLWHTAELCGMRRYRLELEVALEGADEAKALLHFVCTGPPPPTLKLHSFEVMNPALEVNQTQLWQPGQRALVNAIFSIEGGQARRGPQLALFALFDEDKRDVHAENAERYAGLCWDTRELPPEDGTYQLTLRAALPTYFASEASTQHPFSFELALDYGVGKPLRATAVGSVTDYQPGAQRRSREVEERLIRIDRAQQWDLRRIGEAQ